MKVAIVGAGADKFTKESSIRAVRRIFEIVRDADTVISGRSPMGGVDVWAEEIAAELKKPTEIYPARVSSWAAVGGFKDRNLKIARACDELYVLVVDGYPPKYRGRTFGLCYHCRTREHVKSGGCWTAIQARSMGKRVHWYVVRQSDQGGSR